jgi:hypothetical protein
VPVGRATIAVLPATTAALPARTAILLATTATLPAMTATLLATTAALPTTTAVLPTMIAALPATPAAQLATTAALPATTAALLAKTAALLATAAAPLATVAALPATAARNSATTASSPATAARTTFRPETGRAEKKKNSLEAKWRLLGSREAKVGEEEGRRQVGGGPVHVSERRGFDAGGERGEGPGGGLSRPSPSQAPAQGRGRGQEREGMDLDTGGPQAADDLVEVAPVDQDHGHDERLAVVAEEAERRFDGEPAPQRQVLEIAGLFFDRHGSPEQEADLLRIEEASLRPAPDELSGDGRLAGAEGAVEPDQRGEGGSGHTIRGLRCACCKRHGSRRHS